MKNLFKVLAVVMTLVLIVTAFAACGGKGEVDETDGKIKIGVIQFGSHPSLDNCYTGIKEVLEASDLEYELDFQNGNFEQATCDTIAKTMVANGCDIILPIATPPAISAYSACAEKEIPVVFTAVSDPVAAGLVDSIEKVGGHSTGTATVINFDAQLDMIKEIQPQVKKIGVLYTTSEANSVSDVKRIEAAAESRGLEIIAKGIQTSADIPQAAADLVQQVDALNNFADNNVVNNLSVVLEIANDAGIPVYGSEEEQVLNGCLASEGIDYIEVGRQTANLAIEVLGGAVVADLPVTVLDDSKPFINTDILEEFKLEIPEAYKDATMLQISADE